MDPIKFTAQRYDNWVCILYRLNVYQVLFLANREKEKKEAIEFEPFEFLKGIEMLIILVRWQQMADNIAPPILSHT